MHTLYAALMHRLDSVFMHILDAVFMHIHICIHIHIYIHIYAWQFPICLVTLSCPVEFSTFYVLIRCTASVHVFACVMSGWRSVLCMGFRLCYC